MIGAALDYRRDVELMVEGEVGELGCGTGAWRGQERDTLHHSGDKYSLETTRLPALGSTLFIFYRCLYNTVKCILPSKKNKKSYY